jgi:hypothetical protein
MKLPIGISTFKKIREGYLYADKTALILELIRNHSYAFLSRPRRFGKSLLCDTLKELFEGNRELFEGLYIYDKYDFPEHPVIKISFGGIRHIEDLQKALAYQLDLAQEALDVQCQYHDVTICFSDILKKSAKKYGVKTVILIDEYDKPILDNIDKPEIAIEIREYLKRFYTEIKENDAYIRFAFITGVSKFARMSIFSGLNNLDDISLDRRYGSICGYTQEELDAVFGKLLAGVDMEKVRQWYNGYNFEGEDVYNPYDILLFISKEYRYRNYWFSTGTPSFLIKLLKEKNYFVPVLEHLMVDDSVLDSFEIEDIRLEPLLFQSGYLTIGEVRESKRGGIEYSLRIPNKEVQISFNDILLDYFISDVGIKKRNQDVLYDAFDQGDMELLRSNLRSLYGGIPYNYFIKNEMDKYEGYYASVFYAYIASLGMRIIPEDVTSRGRIDFTVEFGKRFYIFEFKVKEESPLKQIKEKRYYEKYLGRGKEVFIIGIVFDEGIRNIKEFEWEKMC